MLYANKSFWIKQVLEAVDDEIEYSKPSDAMPSAMRYITDRLKAEMGWRFDRGEADLKIVQDWLQGLAINIPFYNFEILELCKNGGLVFADDAPMSASEYVDKYEDDILEGYWRYMAVIVWRDFTHRIAFKGNRINYYRNVLNAGRMPDEIQRGSRYGD